MRHSAPAADSVSPEATLQALRRELADALEQQTATAEILRVIARSTADLQPVFDAMAASVAQLTGTPDVVILAVEHGRLRHAASVGPFGRAIGAEIDLPLDRSSICGLALADRRTVHVHDLAAVTDPQLGSARAIQQRYGQRTMIAAPILRGDTALGTIAVLRREVQPFTERQVALLETFADQAAIAIENARLFRETQQALERQTATSEILGVISRMPRDAQPVFEAIVRAGVRLFPGAAVAISQQRDGMVHPLAIAEADAERAARWRRVFPFPLDRGYIHGAAILDARVVDVPDVLETGGQFEAGKRNLAPSGYRAMTVVPLLRGGAAIGALAVVRLQPGALSPLQIGLLQTFADQAVIAIDNAHLFNALQDKTRELEIASRHKSAFLANMSHELRTPLNAILGFTRIVLRETRGQIEPRQAENLDKIMASARHLVGLINATLDLTRIEAGRIEISPSDVVLGPLLEECLRSVEPLCAQGVRLRARLAEELPTLRVDAAKLHQILLNLLGNAVKFTEAGRIELRAAARGDRIAIEVEDSGIGIPPDKLEAVFEEFEQVDASHTRAHGGTGLGLAIARRLARAMGGELSAVSALGRGSTFTLTLPLRWSPAVET